MRIAVKICGFTRPADVAAAVEAGVDAVGFVFDHGPRCLSPEAAPALLELLSGTDVQSVAVTGAMASDRRDLIAELGFDLVQVLAEGPAPGGPYLPVFFDDAQLEARFSAWRARTALPEARLGRLLGTVNVDGAGGGGTGTRADWSRARRIAEQMPLTLSGGLGPDNLEAAVRAVRPWAVDVCSAVESAPGVKDPARMRALLAEVRRLEREAA